MSQGSRHVQVRLGSETLRCSLRKALFSAQGVYAHPVAVGDRVSIVRLGPREGVVEDVLPRSSVFTRHDVGVGKPRVLVSNLDTVCACVSLVEPTFRPRLIDRLVVTATLHELDALIVLTKCDLVDDLTPFEDEIALYQGLGHVVVLVSAIRGDGMAQLRALLVGRTSVFCGHSGVGKSSLLNALDPTFALTTAPVSEKGSKGRHTTTRTTLLPLASGGFVVDTPGFRAFRPTTVEPWRTALGFPEMVGPAGDCHFQPCTHDHEPACGVRNAVAEGRIDERRYLSYLRMAAGEDLVLEDEVEDDEPGDDGVDSDEE